MSTTVRPCISPSDLSFRSLMMTPSACATWEMFLTEMVLYPQSVLLLDEGLPSTGGTAKEKIGVFMVSLTNIQQ